MRIIVFLLLAANALFFILFFPDIMSAYQQEQAEYNPDIIIHSETLTIPPSQPPVDSAEVDSQVSDSIVEDNVEIVELQKEESCIVIERFSQKDSAEQMQTWLREKDVSSILNTNVVITEMLYRVYLGDTAQKKDANKVAIWLTSRGVDNFIYKSGNGKWRVSIGSFRDEETAKEHVKDMQPKLNGSPLGVEQVAKTQPYFSLTVENQQLANYRLIPTNQVSTKCSNFSVKDSTCTS